MTSTAPKRWFARAPCVRIHRCRDSNTKNPLNDTTSEAAIHVRDVILRAAEHIGHKLQQRLSLSVGTDHEDQMLDQSCVERRVPSMRYLDQETGDESVVEVQGEQTHS